MVRMRDQDALIVIEVNRLHVGVLHVSSKAYLNLFIKDHLEYLGRPAYLDVQISVGMLLVEFFQDPRKDIGADHSRGGHVEDTGGSLAHAFQDFSSPAE
jgi:hypothetical protein